MGLFSFLGVLKKIERELEHVEEIAGSSAGSLIGFFLMFGKTVDEMLDIALEVDANSMTKPDLNNIFSNFGFVGHEKIKNLLMSFTGKDFTFLEMFQKTRKKFHVSAYCVNKATTDYFSVDSHPNMSVIDAICMSISIPFIFSAFQFNDFHYLDGGTLEEIPGQPFLNKDQELVCVVKLKHTYTSYEKITQIKKFVELLLNQLLNNRIEYTFKNTKYIDIQNINIFNFNMSHEDKLKLFLIGYSSGGAFQHH